MGGIGVVTNPQAGANRKRRDRRSALERAVGDAGFVIEPDGIAALDAAARTMHERDIDVFAVCGGDGSYFRSLTALARAYGDDPLPPFLPLRGGSMNTIARAVGYRKGTPEAVLARAAQRHRSTPLHGTTWRNLIRVNGRELGFLVGSGAIVRFLESYYARPRRGPLAALRVTVEAALSAATGIGMARALFDPIAASVRCDEEVLAADQFSVIFAAGVAEFGLGFRVAYLADRKPGHFHLLAGRPSPARLAARLPHLKAGWPLRDPGLYDNLAREVVVEFAQPTQYMIDGDVLGSVDRLELSAGPRLAIVQV